MRLSSKFEPRSDQNATRQANADPPAQRGHVASPSPAARNLALAHHVERLIDRGVIADYTQAARMLGVSQPRMTHLMSLLLLAPAIQEAILLAKIAPRDKKLRELARVAAWETQERRFELPNRRNKPRPRGPNDE